MGLKAQGLGASKLRIDVIATGDEVVDSVIARRRCHFPGRTLQLPFRREKQQGIAWSTISSCLSVSPAGGYVHLRRC